MTSGVPMLQIHEARSARSCARAGSDWRNAETSLAARYMRKTHVSTAIISFVTPDSRAFNAHIAAQSMRKAHRSGNGIPDDSIEDPRPVQRDTRSVFVDPR